MNAIPPAIAAVLPLIGPQIASYLGKDKWPQWLNALIAALIFIISAVFWALFVSSLTPNLLGDLLLIVGYIAVLAANPLKALTPYLNISTLFPQSSQSSSTSAPSAATAQPSAPSPLILPTSTPPSTPTPPTTPAA